jgi:hypothetical protein
MVRASPEEMDVKARYTSKRKFYNAVLKKLRTRIRKLKAKAKRRITSLAYNKRIGRYSQEIMACVRSIRSHLIKKHEMEKQKAALKKGRKAELKSARREAREMRRTMKRGRPTI